MFLSVASKTGVLHAEPISALGRRWFVCPCGCKGWSICVEKIQGVAFFHFHVRKQYVAAMLDMATPNGSSRPLYLIWMSMDAAGLRGYGRSATNSASSQAAKLHSIGCLQGIRARNN